MLHIVKGDLLKSNCDIIAHQANCQKMMGAGIAKQIKEQYPSAFQADLKDPRTEKEKFGDFSVAFERAKGKFVFNLYGQITPAEASSRLEYQDRYKALTSSLTKMLDWVMEDEQKNQVVYKIGMPYLMGCALAGGDWLTVEGILIDLSEKYKKDIYLYKLG